jgi:NAD(P)-dependent dehydrogenase (short-subunit alcohol dehydrogenase family)
MAKTFESKVVLVTGANSGIGEAAAVLFVETGATVFGVARRKDTLETARSRHPEVRWLLADVTRANEVTAAVQGAVREAGGLDVLVNNAGIFLFAPLEQTTESLVRAQFEANVYGPTFATRAALPALKASAGRGTQSQPRGRALWCDEGGARVAHTLLGARTRAVRNPRERDRTGPHGHARIR